MNYEQLLLDLCNKTAKILVNLPNESNGMDVNPLRLNSKLIFPNYEQNDKKPRISEQEARFAFCQVFEQEKHGLYYSVETPTEIKYSFTNEELKTGSGISAQSDMSIFSLDNSGFNQLINLEFKARNVKLNQIKKDILKLIKEPQIGLFFHLLQSVGNGTLPSTSFIEKQKKKRIQKGILEKYSFSLNQFTDDLRDKDINWYIIFAICILKPEKFLITKKFQSNDLNNIDNFFKIEYTASRKSISFPDNKRNGWEVTPF